MAETVTQEQATQQQGSRRFLIDVLFMAISPLMLRLRSFIMIPIIVGMLGTAGYGAWAQFEVTMALLVMLISLNMGSGMNRFMAGSMKPERIADDLFSLLCLQFGVFLVCLIPLVLWPSTLTNFIFQSTNIQLLAALAIAVLGTVLSNSLYSLLRAQRYTRELAFLNSLRWWGELLVIVSILFAFRDITSVFSAYAIYQLCVAIVFFGFILKNKLILFHRPTFTCVPQYLLFALPLFGTSIGYWLSNSSDKYIVNWMIGIEQLGVYAALYKFGSIIVMLMEPITEVLLPDASVLYDAHQSTEMYQRFAAVLKYFALIASCALIGITSSTPFLLWISTIGGEESFSYTMLLIFVCLGTTFLGLSRILQDLLSIRHQTWLVGGLWMALGMFNMVTTFLLIPLFGTLGAAIATALTFGFGTILFGVCVRRLHPAATLWGSWVTGTCIATILSLCLVVLLLHHFQHVVPLVALVGIGIHVTLLVVFRVVGASEVAFVQNVVLGKRPLAHVSQ